MITKEIGQWELNYRGLSTDEKPTVHVNSIGKEEGIPNGSIFYEMDTGDIYMWDAENSQWLEQ